VRDTVATILVALLGVHILVKFAFFALPYRRRRAALDKSYGEAPSATKTSDVALLVLSIAVAVLLLWRGVDAVSFLGGIWIGGTLIQLYFHQFHVPVTPERAAPPTVSPIKEMSYAIQDAPWRPWPEMLTLTVLVCWSLALIAVS
jgi:hypothetical protein